MIFALEERTMKKILCATDGTDHSAHAIDLAAALAAKQGAELAICIVNIARGGTRGPLIYSLGDDEVRKVLDGAAKRARDAGASKVEEVVLRSRDAGAAVVQYAEENGFDHIVVGTGDKHGLSRLVLGSVAADIAARAHCSVTVAR